MNGDSHTLSLRKANGIKGEERQEEQGKWELIGKVRGSLKVSRESLCYDGRQDA